MIEKIISDRRTGAGRAAVDAARTLGILHGGYPLNGEHDLRAAPDQNYSEQIKKNIEASCGTLILSHGMFQDPFDFIKKVAGRFGKPLLHIDLHATIAFTAATLINDWITDNEIRILHVTGTGDEDDPKIYRATLDILQAVFFLNLTETNMSNPAYAHGSRNYDPRLPPVSPRTADEAVTLILEDMSLKNRTTLANLREEELPSLQLTLGRTIAARLDQWPHDEAFTASCIAAAAEEGVDISNLSIVIIRKLWKQLRQTHRLRVVK